MPVGVGVATPTSTHADIVISAARAGKAIFCEKPLALAIDQTRAALAAVEGAGVLPQIGIHDFDVARWFMSSEVEHVSAEGSLLACEQLARVGDIDNAVINLRFHDGTLGNVELSRNARYGFDVRTEVLGSEGAVIVGRSHAGEVAEVLTAETAPPSEPPHFVKRFGAAYRAQIEYFVDCVARQRPPVVSGVDALAAFEIAYAATLSQQTGRSVPIADLESASRV